MKLKIIAILFILANFQGCGDNEHEKHHDHEGHPEEHQHAEATGPHGGKLFEDEDFKVELKIFETGTAPKFRIYAYNGEKLLDPEDFETTIKIKRIDAPEEIFDLTPVGNFLTSDKVVAEPHSFDLKVESKYDGKNHSWNTSSYEGRTSMPDSVAKISGIKLENAASRIISSKLRANGKILPSEHKIAHIIPRFSGIVKEGRKHIGDFVEKGEVLAIIESNQSLQPFEVKSQISGKVINGHLILGEFVPENQWVYVVADLSEVWADILVPVKARSLIKEGQGVVINSIDGKSTYPGKISYISPYLDDESQSLLARVIIKNDSEEFLPGMFATGDFVIEQHKAEIAVKKTAVQTFQKWKVVFKKIGDIYEIAPVELGKADEEWVEVLSGLNTGQEYVSENSFLIKADILKSGATHDH